MVVVVIAVLLGNNFLTSSGEGQIDGSVPWSESSVLRSVAELLNLSFRFATPTGSEVKELIFGVGAAIALLVGVIAYLGRSRDEGLPAPATAPTAEPAEASGSPPASTWKRIASLNLTKLHGAQVLMGIAVVWSFQSINWSQHAKLYALGGSVVMATAFLWSLGLSLALDRRTARIATAALVVVSVLTALMAIWYFYERNPNQRAKYPIGNPLFLTAVLIPAALLAVTTIVRAFDRRATLRPAARAARVAGSVVALVLFGWVFAKAGSPQIGVGGPFRAAMDMARFGPRATILGLAFGVTGIVFLAGGRRTRLLSGGVMAVLLIGAIAFIGLASGISDFGRGASIRLRQYAWSYALEFVNARRWTGIGQGGYSLLADGLPSTCRDALIDPEPFQGRVSHAHNEWLETWADLGTLGFVFVIGAYVLTFAAGVDALRALRDRSERWRLIGLMAALMALMVEECANVALRVAGMPAVFFTVLGLVWAQISLAGRDADGAPRSPSVLRGVGRGGVTLAAVIVAASAFFATTMDWRAAMAQAEAPRTARELDFETAVGEAGFAARWRLNPVRRVEAAANLLRVYATAASYRTAQWQDRMQRSQTAGAPAQIETQAREDRRRARTYAQQGLRLAHDIRTRVSPSAFQSGVVEAGLCIVLATIEAGESDAEVSADLQRRAIDALTVEANRHRMDESIVLQLLGMTLNAPTPQFVDYLLGPLRAGPFTESWEGAAAHVMARSDFAPYLASLKDEADKDVNSGNPEKWKRALSPEALRLAAYHATGRGAFDEAADLARRAAQGYRQWGTRLEIATVAALVEESRYRLLGHPDDPSLAAAVAREAMEAVPRIGRADLVEEPILIERVHQHLAGLEENPAADLIVRLNPGVHPKLVPGLVSRAYVGLVHRLLTSRPDPPLELIERWLTRAVELAPEDPEPLLLLCRILHTTERDELLIDRLKQVDALAGDAEVVNQFIDAALAIRESPMLRMFLAARIAAPTTSSAPVTSVPTTQPEAAP
jgi:O-antigen ligase